MVLVTIVMKDQSNLGEFSLKGKFEQMAKALCMSIKTRLIFSFLKQKEFQQMYLSVKVGFLCIDVMNWKSLFSTSMSKKVRE